MKQSEKKNAEAVKSSTTGGSAWSRVVGEADVVCCTLSGAGLLATDHRGKGAMRGGRNQGGAHGAIVTASGGIQHHCAVPLFDAVIIDEAAQATELATLIPLRWLRPGGTCVLVGDPKQLAPTVLCKHPTVESCLSRSLFERMQLAGHHAHLLTTQYRMHPSIRAFPSAAFYESKLRDGVDVNAVKSPLGANYVCVDVRDGRETRKRSTSNQSEVSVCVAVYAQLVRNLRIERNARKRGDGYGDELADTIRTVGVVTPYRDQIELLKRKFAPVLETQDAKFAPVEFATVDGVQGTLRVSQIQAHCLPIKDVNHFSFTIKAGSLTWFCFRASARRVTCQTIPRVPLSCPRTTTLRFRDARLAF
jgi:superfamily I DNA and/or RNA helicase